MTSISYSDYTTKMVNNQCNNKYQSALKRRLAIITGKETEVINKVMASNDYCTKVEGVQNISQLDSLISMIDKLNPSVSDRIKTVCEQAKNNAIALSEQVKVTLETTAIKVIYVTVNINKKIFSRSRTPRSNNRTSSFSKSTKGDSGDSESDQPEPPSPPGLARLFAYPRLISLSQRNKSLFSWQSAPNVCSLVGGGKI